MLVSRRADYDHFHLRMETKLGEGAAAECCCVVAPEDGPGGYQNYGVLIGGTRDPAATTGALVLGAHRTDEVLLSAAPPLAHGLGEWSPLELVAEGNRIRVRIDGKTAVDYVDTNDTFTVSRLTPTTAACAGWSIRHSIARVSRG